MKKLFIIFLLYLILIPLKIWANNMWSANFVASSSQHFTAADSTSLSDTGDQTLEAWVNFSSQPASGTLLPIMAHAGGAGNRGFVWGYQDTAGTKQLAFSTFTSGTNEKQVVVSWTATLNTWYHVVIVYTAAGGTADFYVNCIQQGTQQSGLDTTIFDSTALFTVGRNTETGGGYMDGKLDDLRYYSEIRTKAQICSDYRQEAQAGANNLVNAYWKLNNTLKDETSSANTLTNVNSTTFVNNLPFNYSEMLWGGF